MNCKECLKFIDDFAADELNGQIAEHIGAHIFGCADCAAHYEMLSRESHLYANYLLEIEVPKDLWSKFQTKLEAEKSSHTAERIGWISERTTTAKRFLQLNLTFSGAAAVILFAVCFGLWQFSRNVPNKNISENELAAANKVVQKLETKKAESFVNEEKTENTFESSISAKSVQPKVSLNKKFPPHSKVKFSHAKISEVERKTSISASRKEKSVANKFAGEKQTENLRAKNLEAETIRQFEKIEMLLRSFRNARIVENGETFDVAYETEQAKKLLEKNVSLRRSASNFGTFQTEEILNRVEPYLLDISNLENNPTTQKVLEIKERVKSQNIIAGLQVF